MLWLWLINALLFVAFSSLQIESSDFVKLIAQKLFPISEIMLMYLRQSYSVPHYCARLSNMISFRKTGL